MRRPLAIVLALLVVGLIAAVVYITVIQASATTSTALGGSGTIEAEDTIVAALTSARISKAPFSEGDTIKRGQLMFHLDPTIPEDQVRQAKASVTAAVAQVEQVEDDTSSTAADVAAAKAQLTQAEVSLSIARTQADYSNVYAPVAGVVTNKVADVGEIAAPGASLAVISDVSHLTVTIYVPETEIGRVKVGQRATATVDSSTRSFPAKVTFIASQAEFTPASVQTKDQRAKLVYKVKLSVADSSGILKPGMPADVTF